MSWRRLEDVFSVTFFCLPRRLADVFQKSSIKLNCKMSSWWRLEDVLEDVLKTSWRRLEGVFGRRIANTFWRRWKRLERRKIVTLKTSSIRLEDVLENKKCLIVIYPYNSLSIPSCCFKIADRVKFMDRFPLGAYMDSVRRCKRKPNM